MDVKLLTNVGWIQGRNGKAILYAAKTTGGTNLLLGYWAEGEPIVENPHYYPISQVKIAISTGDAQLVSDLNEALFTDQQNPEFINANGVVQNLTGENDTIVRLFEYQTPYSLKGDGVTTTEINALKVAVSGSNTPGTGTGGSGTGTGSSNSGGALGGLIPSDFSTLFSNPLKFIQDNIPFVALVLAGIYFMRRKKKKPLWII